MVNLGNLLHLNLFGYAHWFMSIRISQTKDHYISLDQAKYATSIVAKYLDTDKVKTSTIFYKTTMPSDMIFTKDDASTSDNQVKKLTREFNIHYICFIILLIYLLSKRVDMSFAVYKLAKFSSNPGKLFFEGMVHVLRYIRDNRTLGLSYYYDMEDAMLSDLLKQVNIKTKNQVLAFSHYIWKYFPDTGRSTGSCTIFYQGGPIDHGTHIPVPVSKSSAESEYNAACTAGMDLAHFRMLIHGMLNKDSDIVPE